MRLLLAVSLTALAFAAGAQSTARPRPAGTVPLDEPPPPPPMTQADKSLEPQVTRREADDQQVEEYRVRGKLYMQRVTPKGGRPYVLMDHKGDGSFTKQDNTIDGHLSVPQWVLMEF
ncbi:MAG: DUF2782 domain-containing protein [Burkholderiales bacterium]|nr:DUF2782 domain-containing protein [Burkholderiales bacterium]